MIEDNKTKQFTDFTGWGEKLLLISILVGTFLSIYDQFVINVAASSISRDLHPSAIQLVGIVSGYAFIYALGLIMGGRIGDRYGQKVTYQTGLLLFTITSSLCGLAQGPNQLVLARLLQGGSAAIMIPQVLSLIRVVFSDTARVKALSWFGVSIGAGQILGQILGGLIPSLNLFGWGWRMIFILEVPLCVIAWILCQNLLPKSKENTSIKIDGVGTLLFSLSCGLFLIPLLYGRESYQIPWRAMLIIGFVILIGFIIQQRRKIFKKEVPLMPFQLFRTFRFSMGILLNIMLYLAIIPFFFILGLYLESVWNYSSWAAGLIFSPIGLGFIIGSLIAPTLVKKLGTENVLIIGTTCTAVALIIFTSYVIIVHDLSVVILGIPLLIFGYGNGTSLPIVTGVVLKNIPVKEAGAGGAILTTSQQLFGTVGVALVSILIFTGNVITTNSVKYIGGFVLITAFSVASLFSALMIKHIHEK